MAPSPTDLEQRVAALESRRQRTDEDANSMMDTIVDTREDVRDLRHDVKMLRLEFDGLKRNLAVVHNDVERRTDRLQRGVDAIATHLGLTAESEASDDD